MSMGMWEQEPKAIGSPFQNPWKGTSVIQEGYFGGILEKFLISLKRQSYIFKAKYSLQHSRVSIKIYIVIILSNVTQFN